jgi:autonomous glycyl radical cofactor GrcA
MTYEEAKAWFDSNHGQMIESRGVATITVSGRSVRFSSKVPEQAEFVKAVSRLKRILA